MKGSELKEARERMGLTLAQLGEQIGRSEGAMSKYENGKTPIPPIVEKAVSNHEAALRLAGKIAAPRPVRTRKK